MLVFQHRKLMFRKEGPADQQIGMVVDPSAFGQRRQQAAVEATRGAIVDVLDAGLTTSARSNFRKAACRPAG
ncbi:hypothetical protein [Bradyrhizobium sp. LTSPM299]|uniref:hypothetical protein n=1 Tax=Bradyrhizobium sp. LTSPM299 TaxID=1619233 RepID=UPI001AEC5310|nr:hypothetical protein [Bradyrhizobium sp. LTSPM299]